MNVLERRKYRGLKIPNYKESTADKLVVEATVPEELCFPMAMHIGAPAVPCVEVVYRVKIGTLLGTAEGKISANIRSSVSGKVVAVEKRASFRGESETVVVQNDFTDAEENLPALQEEIGPKEFSARLAASGITGKGGAGFPAGVKYAMDKEETRYLLVNGSECEPYSTTDYRIMTEYPEEIIAIIEQITPRVSIGRERDCGRRSYERRAACFAEAIKKQGAKRIHIHSLPSEYPAGHAALQIRQVLGIEMEEGQRSGDAGILQSNVYLRSRRCMMR